MLAKARNGNKILGMQEYLPRGMSEDDLRFVHPQLFPPSMAIQGWSVELKFDIDANPMKVDYRLARPVDEGFGIDELHRIGTEIGILDEEQQALAGYNFRVDTFGEGRTEFDAVHDAINPQTDTSRLLIFEFIGFPTNQTMDIMQALERALQQTPQKSLVQRFLGRLSLRKNHPGA